MAFELTMDVEKPGTRTDCQLQGLRVNLNRVHETEVDQYSAAGRYCSAVSPGSSTPNGHWDFMFSCKGKDLQQVFLRSRLKNEIRKTLQYQVADQGREVHIEVIAVIFKFLWIIDHLQAGIPA